MTNTGKAYGFFDCRASKEEIEAELPTIRDLTQVPSELELTLIEGVANLRGDDDLMSLVQDAKDAGMRYVLEATYPNVLAETSPYAANEAAADELSAILNQAYQSPLYQEGEPFRGNIIYRTSNGYDFKN